MVCLDNSEWMRNGDYIPTRMEAVCDAANTVTNRKIISNPENTVGVMSLAGKGPELLVSPTEDVGKIMAALHDIKLFGKLNFLDGVQVAHLALKHRRNKHGGQRLIVFVGSPVTEEPKELKKVAKTLGKNNIAVDVISLGDHEENRTKLEEFVAAVNNNGNSHLVTIPEGSVPADILVSSPILSDATGAVPEDADMEAAIAASTGAIGPTTNDPSGGLADMGGLAVDPNMDPELAMALRVSMEEERARQEREATHKTLADEIKADDAAGSEKMDIENTHNPPTHSEPTAASASVVGGVPTLTPDPAMEEEDEDDQAILQQALAMSMQDQQEVQAMEDVDMADNTKDELAEPVAAIPPSSQPVTRPSSMQDMSFVNSMLASLPGVDPSDPLIQQVLQSDPRIQQALQEIQNPDGKDGEGGNEKKNDGSK